MVQTSYPGIYIQEFTPPSPIAGVGTSTAAFIGPALIGPIGHPTEVTSFDEYTATFGGYVTDSPGRYLTPAVYGFFLNGGTDCFIVRASTAADASRQLQDRNTADPEPVIIVTAIAEGAAGDSLSVVISDSSYLANYLSTLPGVTESTLPVHYAHANIESLSTDRMTITVDNSADFRPGESVVLIDAGTGATSLPVVVGAVAPAPPTVSLQTAVPGTDTYAGGGTLRSADLAVGQTQVLVDVPTAASIALALPTGSTVQLSGTNEIHSVTMTTDGSPGPAITLDAGLTNNYDLATGVPTISSLEFNLAVESQGSTLETFSYLSMNPAHPNWWATAVDSDNVTLSAPPAPPQSPPADPRPQDGTFALTGGTDDNRVAAWSQLLNNTALPSGVGFLDSLLATLTPYGANIVCVPGATTQTAQVALGTYCQQLGNRFAILDAQQGTSTSAVQTQVDGVRIDDGFAALYYPWILVQNPSTGLNEYWPPSGHIAGIYASTDQQGVQYAPANVAIAGAIDVENRLTDADQGPLNLQGVNVLRVFPGQSTPVVWGARTTYTQNDYWQYVNIRRLFIYLEQSIEQGILWAVFQPNNQTLWAQLEREIGDFLTNVWQAGALVGSQASDAFYVRIDAALNPPNLQALGQLNIEIGAAPAYPAEFIIVRIGIWQGGSQISES